MSCARRILYVARHGETDWNAAQRWQGHTDISLNENGRRQASGLARALRRTGLGGIVASDLLRARETASIVAVELGVPLVYIDADLRERSFGCFEGLTREECEERHPQAWRAWLDAKQVPPGGEAQGPLADRMARAITRAARSVARDDAPALVISHGASLRALLAAATGERPPPIANAGILRLAWDAVEERVATVEAL
ncbi:MAG: histidine phosphatase family protein [Myxococcota bacterium]|nr:histidine phosphatase family protein [Myxococcota bacterium]